jgi:hypothetical protein
MAQNDSFLFFINFFIIMLYIVAFAEVYTIYQIYHTRIHPLNHSPLFLSPPIPGIVSIGLIFLFTYMYAQYLHHVHPPTPFSYILPPPTATTPPNRTWSALLFSDFIKEKNVIFVCLR